MKENETMMQMSVKTPSLETARALFGNFDENVGLIEARFGVRISQRDDEIVISGGQVQAQAAKETLERLIENIEYGTTVDRATVNYTMSLVADGMGGAINELMRDVIAVTSRGKQVKAKTLGQKRYVDALKSSTVTFCVGPAGTGKTYIAIAHAVIALKNKEVSRIVLTRPAVEAGERLGFLPGDLQQKVDPYLRPLYDALQDFLGMENFAKYLEKGTIEVAPLAYMRGRTLSDSYIVLDEAQNCTKEQMKMFLTRFGEGSKVVVTGDVTQIDLPPERMSGLLHAMRALKNVKDIAFINLNERDVVRHEIVQNIIKAYEKYERAAVPKGNKEGS